MKFETFILRSLFAACLLVCGLTLISMIHVRPQAVSLAGTGNALGTLLLAAPSGCTLPADGLLCLHADN